MFVNSENFDLIKSLTILSIYFRIKGVNTIDKIVTIISICAKVELIRDSFFANSNITIANSHT
jgi:hypothetical protein